MRRLTDAERTAYRRDGYVVLRGLAGPERLELLRSVARQAVEARDRQRAERPGELAEMRAAELRGEVVHPLEEFHVVEHMYQLWERFPAARRHSLDPMLGNMVRDVLEAGAVRLWFDQVMIKDPGGDATPFHQDNAYAPIEDDLGGCVTIWLALDDVGEDMGTLRYAPGSQRLPALPPVPLDRADSIAELLPGRAALLEEAVGTELRAGDALLHHGAVVHGAGPNRSPRPRPAFLTCYFADGTRRRPGLGHYVLDRDGVVDGAVAEGAGLPVVSSEIA